MLHQRPRTPAPIIVDACVIPVLRPAPPVPALPTHKRFPWDPMLPKIG